MSTIKDILHVYGGPHAVAEYEREQARLAALSRIIRRTLACGQLEKLEDAKRYLDDAPPCLPRKRFEVGDAVRVTGATISVTVLLYSDGPPWSVYVTGPPDDDDMVIRAWVLEISLESAPQGASSACECKGTGTSVGATGFRLCASCYPTEGAPQKPEGA